MQICARKVYFTRKKKTERKKKFQPFDPTLQRTCNLGNQSTSQLLLLHQKTGLQREKIQKSTVAVCVGRALHTSAGTQSLHVSSPPHPSANACLSSYTPNVPTRMLSVPFLPPMGPISSFSFLLSPYKNQCSKKNARQNVGLELARVLFCISSHLTNEETESQKVKRTVQRPIAH